MSDGTLSEVAAGPGSLSPGQRAGRRTAGVVAFALALVVLWEGSKALWGIPTYKLPHTYDIVAEFFRRGGDGQLILTLMVQNAAVTAAEALAGFILGGLAGLALAVIFVNSRLMERGLLPYVVASQTVPILAIAPMVVVWLGTSWVSKAVIAAYLTFFPVTINVLRGLRSIEPDALALLQSYAATPAQILVKLRLPASVPYLFTALRVSATASIIGAIIGELPVGSRYGMGVVIINAAQYYNWRPTNLWAAILVAALLGMGFYGVVAGMERRVVTWRRPATEGEVR